MSVNKLTAKFCETAPVGLHFDGEGLYLHVKPEGKRYWRMAAYFNGKPKLLSFGTYPKVSLAQARDQRKEAKELLKQGIDPTQAKKDKKLAHIKAKQEAAKQEGSTFVSISV